MSSETDKAPAWPRLVDQPYLLLVVASIGWAATTVIGRLAVGHVSPMAIVTLRLGIVLTLLATFAPGWIRAEWPLIRRHFPLLLALGAGGHTAFSALFYWSAHKTTAVNMGLIQGVTPALVLAVAFAWHGTRVTPLQAFGVFVTLVGVGVVASHGSWEVLRHFDLNLGDLGIVGAAALHAVYTVALRNRPPISPYCFFFGMILGAFLASLPLVAIEAARGLVLWPDARGWALIAFIALVPSLLAHVAYLRSVQLVGPGRAGLFMNLIPPIAALLAVAILGEVFAGYHAVGLLFVLGGIWLAERKPIDA